jgi:hypothetical protein
MKNKRGSPFLKVALLDPKSRIYLGMVEVVNVDPLIHLPQITECDLPPGMFRWQEDCGNPFGGAFVQIGAPAIATEEKVAWGMAQIASGKASFTSKEK